MGRNASRTSIYIYKKYGIADKIDAVFTFSGGEIMNRCMAQLSKT